MNLSFYIDSTNELQQYNAPRPLSGLDHNDCYVLDASMIIHYVNRTFPAWNTFVDGYCAIGKVM